MPNHPNKYNFNWENGRVLNEYQINYITKGEGILETRWGRMKIKPGSILLVFPGEWHRYRPNTETGWTEHYIGFQGDFTRNLYQHELFNVKNPLIPIGFQESLVKEYNEILQLAENEKPGFQKECAGKVMYMLGRIISIVKNHEFADKEIERVIREACLYMRDNLHKNVNIENFSVPLKVSYPYFRKMFKKYTGMSPKQYHLGLRIQKSKELILYSQKSIKEIALALGFDSVHHFSRTFKNKEQVSPSSLRQKQIRGGISE